MPYLKEIVDAINTSLSSGNLSGNALKVKYYGICQTAYVNNNDGSQDELPQFIAQSGQGTFTGFNDNYNLTLYHRNTGLLYEDMPEEEQFGDEVDNKIETAEMRCVVFADRSKIKMTHEQLALLISAGMKDGITTLPAQDGLFGVDFILKSITTDPLAVYNEEYKTSVPLPVKPEHLYFAINYEIKTSYSEACYPTCLIC
jgi:hypothetical protein